MSSFWQIVLISGTTSMIVSGLTTCIFLKWYGQWREHKAEMKRLSDLAGRRFS